MTTTDLVKRIGLTQYEIGATIGVSASAVSQCLTGRAISRRIAEAVDRLAGVETGTTLALCLENAQERREAALRRLAAKGIALEPQAEESALNNKD